MHPDHPALSPKRDWKDDLREQARKLLEAKLQNQITRAAALNDREHEQRTKPEQKTPLTEPPQAAPNREP